MGRPSGNKIMLNSDDKNKKYIKEDNFDVPK